jgi:hypothetical protein
MPISHHGHTTNDPETDHLRKEAPMSARWLAMSLIVLLGGLASCSYPKAPYDPPFPTLANRGAGAPAPYVMLVGDSLSIKFFK